jgi:two-component system phosphate regulon sensor histidine kinase PhoR
MTSEGAMVGLLAALIGLTCGTLAFALLARRARAAAGDAREAAPEAGLPGIAALIDAVEEPFLVVQERRVLIANRAARMLLGAHIEGSDVRLAIRHPAAAEHLAGRDGGEEPVRTELVGLGDLGRQWEMIVAPLPDGAKLVRLADQSQQRAAEQMRVDFVANASHELRTPLATLIGFIETLQDEAAVDADTRQRFIGIMGGEAIRMRDLLDDLMSLSRIEADRFAPPRETVDLKTLVDVRTTLKSFAEGRAIRVEKCAGEALVGGDRGQLAQMLTNLVVNALKYGRAGTQVRIRLADEGPDLVSLSVIDKGDGIPADHIPRLTERFYRVDPGRSRQVGGTGLGLAIVKHIVLRHRGRLEIKSKPGVGTRVEVTLPRAVPTAVTSA